MNLYESILDYQISSLIRSGRCDEIILDCDEEEIVESLFRVCGDRRVISESSKTILDCIGDAARGEDVDEGLIGGILGTVGGIAFGPKIGSAICNALGIQKGALYDLFTSRLVTTAICMKLGIRA